MKKRILILVEGKADATFIRDYILFLDESYILNKDKKEEKQLENTQSIIKIMVVGGYTKIKSHLRTRLSEISDFNYNIIVIQDADDPSKQDGGVINRMKFIEKIQSEFNVFFDTFLFPNNEEDGDLEHLLLKIPIEHHFNQSYKCYCDYAKSLIDFSPKEHSDELLENKHIIFNYFRTYNGMNEAKEENRVFNIEYWDFNNKELDALKMFLLKFITNNG